MHYLRQFLHQSPCGCCICINPWVENGHATHEAISACGSVRNVERNICVCAIDTNAEPVTAAFGDTGSYEHAHAVTKLYSPAVAFRADADAGTDALADSHALNNTRARISC
jgi:hypothetical protein